MRWVTRSAVMAATVVGFSWAWPNPAKPDIREYMLMGYGSGTLYADGIAASEWEWDRKGPGAWIGWGPPHGNRTWEHFEPEGDDLMLTQFQSPAETCDISPRQHYVTLRVKPQVSVFRGSVVCPSGATPFIHTQTWTPDGDDLHQDEQWVTLTDKCWLLVDRRVTLTKHRGWTAVHDHVSGWEAHA